MTSCATTYLNASLYDVVAQPKSDDCIFTVLEAPPEAPYDELSIFAPVDIESEDLDEDVASFRDSAVEAVCEAGGDALVAERDGRGRYVRGTIIKYK